MPITRSQMAKTSQNIDSLLDNTTQETGYESDSSLHTVIEQEEHVAHISSQSPSKEDDSQVPVSSPKAGTSNHQIDYDVEGIIGHKIAGGKLWFRVHWKGYPIEEATLEPKRDLP